MESIATGVSNLLASLNTDAAKELHVALNNQAFKQAVIRTWPENPDGAAYLLAHVNGLYVTKDEAPRKGADKDKDHIVLGVYLDDALARAELNARREILRLSLAQEELHVDEVRDHVAMRDMKDRHLYPDAVERIAHFFGKDLPYDPFRFSQRHGNKEHATADQSALLEIVKRAFCLAFEDMEQAWAILEKVEGAALTEVSFNKDASHTWQRYRCHLYVDAAHVEGMQAIIDRYGETVICYAKQLKLLLREFVIHASPESLKGNQAFPRSGWPEALRNTEVQELRSESARVAAEVRRKLHARD